MKKILLSLVALTMAVAANAFTLTLRNSDLGKDETVTADMNDVLGDGKVAVHFDSENKTIEVSLDEATLTDGANPVFVFTGDANYTTCNLLIKGQCAIAATGQYNNAIRVVEGSLCIVPDDPATAKLDISGNAVLFHFQNNSQIWFNIITGLEAFDINITSGSTNQPVFLGNGGSGTTKSLYIAAANVTITSASSSALAVDMDAIACAGKLSNGVEISSGEFVKDGNPYAGNLTIMAPLPISIGTTLLFPDEVDDFQPTALSTGKISYDIDTRTLTFEDVTIDGNVIISCDNVTIYLKGENNINNDPDDTNPRIKFAGKNAKIDGDVDGELWIDGGNKSVGIWAEDGLEIGDFNILVVRFTTVAIAGQAGSTSENNVLTLNTADLPQIRGKEAAIKDFNDLVINSPEMTEVFDEDFIYNKALKALVEKNDEEYVVKNVSLTLPQYLWFCNVPVTVRNASDIKVFDADGKASYDKNTKTLTLNGFKNNIIAEQVIKAPLEALTVKLVGTNIVEGSATGAAIETNFDLTIEGPGSMQITADPSQAGIEIATSSVLTIQKDASVEITGGSEGIKTNASISCMSLGMDPEAPIEPDGDAAGVLNINHADLHITAVNAAVIGFKELNLKNAEITTIGVYFEFGCLNGSGMEATYGIYEEAFSDYAVDVTIAKTAATAISNTSIFENGQKRIIDGKLFIICVEHMYDAQGQMVK